MCIRDRPCGDAVGRGDQVRAERIDQLAQRDHRAGRGDVDGGDYVARPVADRRGDRVEVLRELFVVDGEARLEHLVELIAQCFLAGDRVRALLVSFIEAISSRWSEAGRLASSSLPIAVQYAGRREPMRTSGPAWPWPRRKLRARST